MDEKEDVSFQSYGSLSAVKLNIPI
jgi:hypothetical protein